MKTKNRFPWYAPLFWHGMPSVVWWKLLRSNSWSVDWSRLHFATSVSLSTPMTDTLALTQRAVYGKAISDVDLIEAPIFILGHWRSGTTLLHELLQLDERFSSPNTYQCFAPWHFLITETTMHKFGNFLIPDKRPMDNMRAGWRLPQEDEFALMALGVNSVYSRIAFPRRDVDLTTLSSRTLTGENLEIWKSKLEWFLKAVTLREQKRLILKSPPHTGRLRILAEMYPNSKFIHITRNPKALIPSTIKLWSSLDYVQGLQGNEDSAALEDFVFDCFDRMYDGYNEARNDFATDRLIEISYEELVADPQQTIANVYAQLDLKQFEQVRNTIAARMHSDQNYQTNIWDIEHLLANRIRIQCKDYIQRYRYEV